MAIALYRVVIFSSLHFFMPCYIKLRKERRLKFPKNRTLRRIFGPKRDELTGEWGRLHNEEFNNPYF